MNVRSLVTVPQALNQFSPCCSGWIISTVIPLSSMILLLVHSTLLWIYPLRKFFFFSIIMLSSSKISICFFIISSNSLLKFCFHFFQTYLLLLVEVFYNCFSIFVRWSQLPCHLNAGIYWLCSYIQFETPWFLVWQVVFSLKSEIMNILRLNFIWTPVWTGFFWYSSGRRGRNIILILPGKGMSLHSILGLHWHLVGCEAGQRFEFPVPNKPPLIPLWLGGVGL